MPDYNSDKYNCNNNYIQSSAYLLLSCSKYTTEYNKIKEKLHINNLSLRLLLIIRDEI